MTNKTISIDQLKNFNYTAPGSELNGKAGEMIFATIGFWPEGWKKGDDLTLAFAVHPDAGKDDLIKIIDGIKKHITENI